MTVEPEDPLQEPLAEKAVVLRRALIGLAIEIVAAGLALTGLRSDGGILFYFTNFLLFSGLFVSGCSLTKRWNWFAPSRWSRLWRGRTIPGRTGIRSTSHSRCRPTQARAQDFKPGPRSTGCAPRAASRSSRCGRSPTVRRAACRRRWTR